MTQGPGFLLAMLVEGFVAAVLGWWLGPRPGLSRSGMSMRCGAASVIGTGVTHPVLWLELSRLVEAAGSWWAGALFGLCLVILGEALFYAAALRGHWRLSVGVSAASNVASFGAAFLINWSLAKPA